MSSALDIIRREHEKIFDILSEICSFLDEEEIDSLAIANLLHDFGIIWNSHELREERIFAEKNRAGGFPEETMLVEQHRELRGHWMILQEAIGSGDEEKIRVALDTDGRMLIDKFRKHIQFEEEYFDSNKH
ncbi:hemerythrin domain-containing protein [Candidatus Pacearchaeota archaeon]|nr:hemerythrin domain-containing protein [Candidatus Pacearchaeota archaeon]